MCPVALDFGATPSPAVLDLPRKSIASRQRPARATPVSPEWWNLMSLGPREPIARIIIPCRTLKEEP